MIQFTKHRRAALNDLESYIKAAPSASARLIMAAQRLLLANEEYRSFLLPSNGEIISRDVPSILTLESCRLPFPSVFLEYDYLPNYFKPTTEERSVTPSAAIISVSQREFGDGAKIGAFVFFKVDGRWFPSVVGFQLTDKSSIEVREGGNVRMQNVTAITVPGSVLDADTCLRDCTDEARVLAHFVLLCNCDNVSPERLFTPDAKLVKRCEERGSLPPDEYWVLDCFLGEHHDKSASAGGSHASPRFHVRRGHVRRLADGRLTWVRQCTVGNADLGVTRKDYRVMGLLT